MTATSTLPLFAVAAENRSAPERVSNFLVAAASHREAWRVARQVCKTGSGAKLRDLSDANLLHDYPLRPGELTVTRVLSTTGDRRGRPPKLRASDLVTVAQLRGVALPKKLQRVLAELQQPT